MNEFSIVLFQCHQTVATVDDAGTTSSLCNFLLIADLAVWQTNALFHSVEN